MINSISYSPVFYASARIESAYGATQTFIAEQAPVLEKHLKRLALVATVRVLQVALIVADWAIAQAERAPEHQLQAQLVVVKAKRWALRLLLQAVRFGVQLLIEARRLDELLGVSRRVLELWASKAAIARRALDAIFCLN